MRKMNDLNGHGKFSGLTFIELMISLVVLSVLALVALPRSDNDVRRVKEAQLRNSLSTMRTAIDRYWEEEHRVDPAKPYNKKYPLSLQVLVEKRFLRQIPKDPFTNSDQWQTVSSTDPMNAIMTNKENVFDIHSLSDLESDDGTKYKEW